MDSQSSSSESTLSLPDKDEGTSRNQDKNGDQTKQAPAGDTRTLREKVSHPCSTAVADPCVPRPAQIGRR